MNLFRSASTRPAPIAVVTRRRVVPVEQSKGHNS